MATGTRRPQSDPKPEAKDQDPSNDGEGEDHTDEGNEPESGAVVNPAELLKAAQEEHDNSDQRPPSVSYGQASFLLFLTYRVLLGFDEEQANHIRTRDGASGMISHLKKQAIEAGMIEDRPRETNGNRR